MQELIDFRIFLSELSKEGLLNELIKQAEDKEYNRYVSRNEDRVKVCNDKILLLKLEILER